MTEFALILDYVYYSVACHLYGTTNARIRMSKARYCALCIDKNLTTIKM